jgi:hypothetical protein
MSMGLVAAELSADVANYGREQAVYCQRDPEGMRGHGYMKTKLVTSPLMPRTAFSEQSRRIKMFP